MKQRSKKRPLRQSGDSKKMTEAINWAQKHGLEIYRTTDLCLHIEGYNFWPDKGTIQWDDRPRHKEKGLAALARLLKKPPPGSPPGPELNLGFDP